MNDSSQASTVNDFYSIKSQLEDSYGTVGEFLIFDYSLTSKTLNTINIIAEIGIEYMEYNFGDAFSYIKIYLHGTLIYHSYLEDASSLEDVSAHIALNEWVNIEVSEFNSTPTCETYAYLIDRAPNSFDGVINEYCENVEFNRSNDLFNLFFTII